MATGVGALTDGRLRAVAVAAATVLLTACQASPAPEPSSAPPPPEPTRSYTEEELALYREAVQRVERFEARNQALLAAGKATREARRFYRDRLRDWEESYAQLQEYEREGITVARRPVVLSTRAASIKSFQDDAAEIVLTRCTDQSDLGATRNGSPLPAVHEEPVVQEVVVHRYENRTWLIGSFETTDVPCDR